MSPKKTNVTKKTITKDVIKRLKTAALNNVEEIVKDTSVPGFYLRRYTTGRLAYAVRFARSGPGSAVTLGDVDKWPDPEKARTYAQALIVEWKTTGGKVAKVERPDVANVATRTTAEVFGLRARFATDGVEIAGLYRDKQRHGRKVATGHVEYLFDRFVLSVGPSTPFASLTSDHVEKWIATERKRINPQTGAPTKENSLIRLLADLRTGFRWAVAKKIDGVPLIKVNPAASVRVERTERKEDKTKQQRFLNSEEEARLYAALAARDERQRNNPKYFGPSRRRDGCVYVDQLTPLVITGLETGARRGALFNLRWKDLETVNVLDPKTRERKVLYRVHLDGAYQKARQTYYVAMSIKLRTVLAAWKPKDAAPSDLIFPGLTGNVQDSTPDSWYTLRATIGLEWFRYHDTRHTFPSKLVQRGVNLKKVSVLMGHASIRMTERYAHLDPNQDADIVELLAVPLPSIGSALDVVEETPKVEEEENAE